jgi:hypothetical protein
MVGRPGSTIPYDFSELVEPVADQIDALWFAATGSVVFSTGFRDGFPDDATFAALFDDSEVENDSPIWERAWLKPGGLKALAPLVQGDWTDIVGVQESCKPAIADVKTDTRWLEAHAEVYFSCVDAAFWAVFSSHPEILSLLRHRFPQSGDISLDDRWW